MFQVKKSSQSKKLMRQMDKERRRKAKGIDPGAEEPESNSKASDLSNKPPTQGGAGVTTTCGADADNLHLARSEISGKNKIHTEIRTDDFVVRLLLSNSCRNTHDVSPKIHKFILADTRTFGQTSVPYILALVSSCCRCYRLTSACLVAGATLIRAVGREYTLVDASPNAPYHVYSLYSLWLRNRILS